MDKRILVILIAIIVLLGAIFGIKLMMRDKCEPPKITYAPLRPLVGESVTFNSNAKGDGKVTWKFADGQTREGNEINFVFTKEGTQKVIALTGDDCQDTKEFLVEMKKEFKTTAPSISFNSNIIAGTPTTFRGITPDAEEWNWTIKEIGKKSSGKEFTHTFDKPGKYTVETSMKGKYIGGDTTFIVTVSKKVIVIAKPPPIIEIPKPKTKVVTEIGVPPPPPPSNFGNTVLEISNQLANGNADASDRWLDEISSQLCNGCSVKINTDKARNENITITQFKNRLMNGDIDVSSVVASIDKKTKCVTQLTVVANSKK